jgi:hypothetical protein
VPETRLPDHLRRYPLFARLAEAEVAQLAERMRALVQARRGALPQGRPRGCTCTSCWRRGEDRAARRVRSEALISSCAPATFGELALFDGSPRSASAALEDYGPRSSRAMTSSPSSKAHPARVRVVLDALAKTIRRLSDRVEDLIFLDVPSRVAKYLLDLAQADGNTKLELTLTQDELAAFIGRRAYR